MVTKSPARDGSLAVLQLAAVPRDDEASGVAFLLCLTRMYLWMLFSAISAISSAVPLCGPPLWRRLQGIYRQIWSVVLVKHRLGLTHTSCWRKPRPIGLRKGLGRPAQGLQAGRPGPFLAPFGPIFCVWPLPFIPHLSPVVTMRQNISENVQFPVKMQHAPKSRTKSKMVKFGCQVAG